MFENERYLTSGVQARIPPPIQLLIWSCIDTMPKPKDYLQVFRLSVCKEGQRIIHAQEEPEYQKTLVFPCETPTNEKVYVIDDGEHTTMLLAEEY